MLDWLHWGGQLILSGPDTLDSLRGSFLEPYLPATSAGAGTARRRPGGVEQAMVGPGGRPLAPVQALGRHPPEERRPRPSSFPTPATCWWSARWGGGGSSSRPFASSSPDLIYWPGWDGMFNACLLRRPPRDSSTTEQDKVRDVRWTDTKAHPDPWDPRLNSRLRFFARDAAVVPPKRRRAAVGNGMSNRRNSSQPSRRSVRRGRGQRRQSRRWARAWPPGTTSARWPTPPGRPPACRRHQGPGPDVHGVDRGRLRAGAGAAELDRLPLAGPRGMGVGRRPADRHRSAPRWSSTWPS